MGSYCFCGLLERRNATCPSADVRFVRIKSSLFCLSFVEKNHCRHVFFSWMPHFTVGHISYQKKTGYVRMNVTVRHVRATIVAVETISITYCKCVCVCECVCVCVSVCVYECVCVCVCVCSPCYPACNGHAPSVASPHATIFFRITR